MDCNMQMRVLAMVVPSLLLALAGGAKAQEFCVTCTGPEAQYRCLIGGEATPAARSARGQFLCITALAKDGNHASCSATRAQATPCPGPTRTVMFQPDDGSGGAPPLAEGTAPVSPTPLRPASPTPGGPAPLAPISPTPPPPGGPSTAAAPPPAQPAPPAEAKPNMVEDLANKTGKAMNDTSEAVGGAIKKSWDCVASLFGNC